AVEALVQAAAERGPVQPEAARWLAKTSKLATGLYSKIARVGLIADERGPGSGASTPRQLSSCRVQLIVKESRRIQFTDADGSRRTIDMGRASPKTVNLVLAKVEALRKAQDAGLTFDPTAALTDLPPKLSAKLAGVGLIGGRRRGAVRSLGAF